MYTFVSHTLGRPLNSFLFPQYLIRCNLLSIECIFQLLCLLAVAESRQNDGTASTAMVCGTPEKVLSLFCFPNAQSHHTTYTPREQQQQQKENNKQIDVEKRWENHWLDIFLRFFSRTAARCATQQHQRESECCKWYKTSNEQCTTQTE